MTNHAEWLRAWFPIDPRSTVGVLLREFDTPEQARDYALRRVRALDAAGRTEDSMREDYYNAAVILAEHYPP